MPNSANGNSAATKDEKLTTTKNEKPFTMPSSLTRKEMNRLYQRINNKKKTNIKEGKDECDDLPHQDVVKSRPSKTNKQEQTNKKRKVSLDAQRVKYKDAAKHVFARLMEASDFMDEWADLEPKKKTRKVIKDRKDSLEICQEKGFEKVNLKWELKVTYDTPESWKIGDLSVCKSKNILRHSYTLKIDGLDWFEVKPSTIKEAGLGLFAARRFFEGNLIGIFMGKYDPDDKNNTTGYQFKNIDPCLQGEEHLPYFGLHFANDPLYKKDVKRMPKGQATKLAQKVNIEFGAGYDCHATKRIEKGAEIFVLYEAPKTLKVLKEVMEG